MGFHSVEAIEDAVERTKDIVLPFDLLTWTKLAVIILFLGGAGFSTFFFNFPFTTFTGFEESSTSIQSPTGFESAFQAQTGSPELVMPALGIGMFVISVAAIGLIIAMYPNSLAEFVMFGSVESRDVQLRDNISSYFVDAVKYSLFKAVYGLLVVGLLIAWLGSFAVQPIIGLLLTAVFIPLMILVMVFGVLVHDFVLLKIIRGQKGFIEAVQSVFRTVRVEWREVGVYIVVRVVISWAVGLMSLTVIGSVSLLFILVFGVLMLVLGLFSPILAAVPALLGLILWVITLLYLVVPFRTYMFSFFVEVYMRIFE
ncbi:DUF7544 domain-containing protein [Candidatus Nanohalobium constans]|uniref:Uncharacterized protein n=1 Tax=Candidatus Nanohalobium constans TaxID=2565781 RepID=A0A5Q0UF96_9ARCH|nr:hypothetical protein [Candidatus Nanohalobium constans]QGA80174.1 hypothetical protein LC1Nh_0271 [Candidatus Nanohalobium constans]